MRERHQGNKQFSPPLLRTMGGWTDTGGLKEGEQGKRGRWGDREGRGRGGRCRGGPPEKSDTDGCHMERKQKKGQIYYICSS